MGPSWGEVEILEPIWPKMADKMATWRQVGVKMHIRWPNVAKTYKTHRKIRVLGQ